MNIQRGLFDYRHLVIGAWLLEFPVRSTEVRSFGDMLEPRYIFGAVSLDQ
jgi:hypothetical protein